jgi:endonuclease YncB( thermonuclease family)
MLRLVLTLAFLLPMSVAMADVTGKARVVDGDTIHIGKTKIRLHGIDAPETKQECYRMDGSPYRCGEAATDALRVLIGADPVRCDGGAYDRFRQKV